MLQELTASSNHNGGSKSPSPGVGIIMQRSSSSSSSSGGQQQHHHGGGGKGYGGGRGGYMNKYGIHLKCSLEREKLLLFIWFYLYCIFDNFSLAVLHRCQCSTEAEAAPAPPPPPSTTTTTTTTATTTVSARRRYRRSRRSCSDTCTKVSFAQTAAICIQTNKYEHLQSGPPWRRSLSAGSRAGLAR